MFALILTLYIFQAEKLIIILSVLPSPGFFFSSRTPAFATKTNAAIWQKEIRRVSPSCCLCQSPKYTILTQEETLEITLGTQTITRRRKDLNTYTESVVVVSNFFCIVTQSRLHQANSNNNNKVAKTTSESEQRFFISCPAPESLHG